MKKKLESDGPDLISSSVFKILRVMKLMMVLICFIGLLSSFGKSYSQNTKLSVEFKNSSIESVLNYIESSTEYSFMYDNKKIDISREVNISAKDQTVEAILDQLFENEVYYKMIGKHIIITPKEEQFSVASEQQQKSISGKVIDSTGAPLPGVTIVVKGTTIGIITDTQGNYSLSNIPASATLQFSFVGMKTQEVKTGTQTTINITLADETIGLDEVVAIGYGTAKKSDLTGAVSSIKGDLISSKQSTQISQALQGTISGVMVTRNNSAPGSTATIRIRGVTTIGDSNPLVIVDGVPVDDINSVNPNDVENLTVLKDAASASIYGSRAASGVILITTKRAKEGDLSIDYNCEYGFEKPTERTDYVNAMRYMQMVNEWSWNDNNNNSNEYPVYSKDVIDNYDKLNSQNPDLYPITDWFNLIIKDNAPKQSQILSFSAGTKSIQSKASIAYDKIDGLYANRSYERLTARFNNNIVINKYFSASLDFYAKRSINKQPSMDPMYYTRISAPIYAATWSDGRVAAGKSGGNIYGVLNYEGFNNSWGNEVGGKSSIEFTPIDGLKLSATLSANLVNNKGKIFKKIIPYYAWDDPNLLSGYIFMGANRQGDMTSSLNESRTDNYRITSQFLANYTKTFKNHNLNVMFGNENFHFFNEDLTASRDKYTLTSFPYLNLGPLDYDDNSGSAYENAYRSFFGRIMYNYRSKYFFQGNIRKDGSSRFYKDYRWGSFPSLSAGWAISEENFMKNIPALSFMKVRASWGTLGNEKIGNYPYQATLAFNNALFYSGTNVVSSQTAAQVQYAIKNISWETTESLDFGIDANFFNNNLRLVGDYYKKTTKDMLLALEIPDYIGFDNPNQNTGKMNTKGWEFEIGWNNKINELNYSISVNLADFKSVMGDLGGTEFLGDQIKINGSEYNEWYGYRSNGLFQTQNEVDTSPKLSSNVKPGDVKYKDISGPNGVPDGKITPDYDRVFLGGSLPRYMYGGNIRLDYRNFDFSLAFQGVGKRNVKYDAMMVQPLQERWGSIPSIIDGEYWSKYNSDEQNQKARYPRLSATGESNNYAMSDFWLFNGAYFRVKNATIGYSLPKDFINKFHLQGIRFYISASDFLSFNKYPKGWDPEVSGTGYPITGSLIIGANVKF